MGHEQTACLSEQGTISHNAKRSHNNPTGATFAYIMHIMLILKMHDPEAYFIPSLWEAYPSRQPKKKEVCTHISELDEAHFPELADAVVCWSRLQEELCQAHLLAPEARAHLTAAGGIKQNPIYSRTRVARWVSLIPAGLPVQIHILNSGPSLLFTALSGECYSIVMISLL